MVATTMSLPPRSPNPTSTLPPHEPHPRDIGPHRTAGRMGARLLGGSGADQTALRPALLRDLGAMPFESGALISRSLWVILIGEWGVWTRAVLPVDDRLGMPDKESIAGLCVLVGSLIRPPLCHDDEKAMIVLRRPGPAEISEADGYIFRLVRDAAIGRETAPWAFYVVGPNGIREVTEREVSQAGRKA